MRAIRYIPSVVIAGATFILAACVPPLPPFQGPVPVPIPWVAPTQDCMHWRLPGWRYSLVVPQRGVWGFEWHDTQGIWYRSNPSWFEAGQTFTIETVFPFHLVWAPDTVQGTAFHVVSPDFTPQPTPADLCPDF